MYVVPADELRAALIPWLGSLILDSSSLIQDIAAVIVDRKQKRTDLVTIHEDINALVMTQVSRITAGRMWVILDHYQSKKLTLEDFRRMTDAVMELIFDTMLPFSENFTRLRDYSLRIESLAALKVLYLRYQPYFKAGELDSMLMLIKAAYPQEMYQEWLDG